MKPSKIEYKKLLIVFFIIYFLIVQYLTIMINVTVTSGLNTYRNDLCLHTFVSEEIFEQMNLRSSHYEEGKSLAGVSKVIGPVVVHWFTGAKAIYIYTHYEIGKKFELLSAAWDSVVFLDIDMIDGKWSVTKKWEPISVTQYITTIKEWLTHGQN